MNTDASTSVFAMKLAKAARIHSKNSSNLSNSKNLSFSQSNNVVMIELKQRILTSLSKLSDRDTHQIAVDDLESMIHTLPSENLPMLLNCLCEASSDPKISTKKESIRLIALLCTSHGDSAFAHLSKIVVNIVRRLRDSDSGVRESCRDAVGSLSSVYMKKGEVYDSVLNLFSRPLLEAMNEQSKGVQIGAALCMCRLLEFACYISVSGVQKLCPRISKLLNSPNFFAKAALLPVVAILSKVEGISNQSMETLLQCTRDSIVSSDWTTRKAAADTLISLAPRSKELFTDRVIASTLTTLEDGRFDKIKPVRDSLVEALQLWRKIAGKSDVSNIKISSDGCGNLEQPGLKEKKDVSDSCFDQNKTPAEGIHDASQDSSSKNKPKGCISDKTVGILKKKAPTLTEKNLNPNFFQNLEARGSGDLPVEVVVPLNSSTSTKPPFSFKEPESNTSNFTEKPDSGTADIPSLPKKVEKTPDLNSVKKPENEDSEFYIPEPYSDEPSLNSKGNWFSIQRQLLLLERQQTHLLKMVQDFMGSSNEGMTALEKRVLVLEQIVEEMVTDLSISSQKNGKLFSKSVTDEENRPTTYERPDGSSLELKGGERDYRNGPVNGRRRVRNGSQFGQMMDPKHGASNIGCRRGWDMPNGLRSGEGPSARSIWQAVKDEATLEAIRVAGEDGKYVHVSDTSSIGVVEDGNVVEKNERVWGSWSTAISALQMGDFESAYSEILAVGDPVLLAKMMSRSGPVLGHLSKEMACEVLHEVARFLQQQRFLYNSFSWIEQLMEMVMENGENALDIPMELKRSILSGLVEAPHVTYQLVLNLSSAWGIPLRQ